MNLITKNALSMANPAFTEREIEQEGEIEAAEALQGWSQVWIAPHSITEMISRTMGGCFIRIMLCLLSSTLSVRIAIDASTEREDGHATGSLSGGEKLLWNQKVIRGMFIFSTLEIKNCCRATA